ncbi:MAG: ArnT family glycosyltransferase [Candidatus Hodarchaeota archaeon]
MLDKTTSKVLVSDLNTSFFSAHWKEMTSSEEKPDIIRLSRFRLIAEKLWIVLVQSRFVIIIGLLAFWVKIVHLSSIDMWDEGWFVAIASRMADGLSDPFLPLYYPAEGGGIKFFDKPPVAFWGGAILMNIFGRTTFAAKGIVILGGTGLALIVYFLYSHQFENNSASIIAGLLVALASFLTFYSRTAYIDPFVIFMGAFVMLIAIRAVDAIFVENNKVKGYFLLFLAIFFNILNLLTKAWQGILIAPAVVIYLVFRYIERHIELKELKAVWGDIRLQFTLSTKDMESFLFIHFPLFNFKVPFPFFVFIVTLGSSIIGAFLIKQLFVSSLIIAIISAFGCYAVFLKHSIAKKNQYYFEGLVVGCVSGAFAGMGGEFIVKIFYERLAGSFLEIAQALSEEDVFTGGFFQGILSSTETFLSNESLALLVVELIGVAFGTILAFFLAFFITGTLLDLFTREKSFLNTIYEGLDIIPLIILGAWFGFWFVVLLFLGLFYNREATAITIVGVLITTLLTFIILEFPGIKNRITKKFNLNTRLRSSEEVSLFKSHLLFLSIAIVLIIISFYPFVAWVQFLDTNILNGTFPWEIRKPGELHEPPTPLTYTFLFFEYYTTWRFTYGTKYSLAESIGSALNDYMLIVLLPFFIVGIAAFFFSNKRNPALGSAFLAWLVTVPFVFFPAKFQLNYYYIPLVIPYFAIAAKGIEYIYSSERWRITVDDNIERFLAGGYFYVDIGLSFVIYPLIDFLEVFFQLISGSVGFSTFLSELDSFGSLILLAIVLIVPFTFLTFRTLKTFPGIITLGFAYKFFIMSWIKEENIKKFYDVIFHDLLKTLVSLDFLWIQDIIELGAPLVTLIGIVLLIFVFYWLKPKVKPQALIILGLSLSGMLINVSVNAHHNQIYDLRFQEIAIYIKNHGGGYNYSTWVIPEAGAQFAMRYYLGYEVIDPGYNNQPISSNSTYIIENYYQEHNQIKFWILINNSKHWDVPAYAINYSAGYRWFTTHEHLVSVDDIVGLTSWYKLHLFVNRTWITEQNYDWTKLSG